MKIAWELLKLLMMAVAGLLMVFAAFVVGCMIYVAHPDDEELIENFTKHEAEFNRLVEMIKKDDVLSRVDDDWTEPKDPKSVGISEERIAEYRKIFKKLEIPRGFSYFKKEGDIQFIANTQGLATGGSMKGYVYAEKTPEPLTENTDTYDTGSPASYTVYRPVSGKWYLIYEYDD
jgi:hypothetical protein